MTAWMDMPFAAPPWTDYRVPSFIRMHSKWSASHMKLNCDVSACLLLNDEFYSKIISSLIISFLQVLEDHFSNATNLLCVL